MNEERNWKGTPEARLSRREALRGLAIKTENLGSPANDGVQLMRTRRRSKSKLARPYPWRLMNLSLFTRPSTWPLG